MRRKWWKMRWKWSKNDEKMRQKRWKLSEKNKYSDTVRFCTEKALVKILRAKTANSSCFWFVIGLTRRKNSENRVLKAENYRSEAKKMKKWKIKKSRIFQVNEGKKGEKMVFYLGVTFLMIFMKMKISESIPKWIDTDQKCDKKWRSSKKKEKKKKKKS